jgi:hypothetical protein
VFHRILGREEFIRIGIRLCFSADWQCHEPRGVLLVCDVEQAFRGAMRARLPTLPSSAAALTVHNVSLARFRL